MRKFLLSVTFVFVAVSVFAQAPDLINYQGVARNNQGEPITNTQIGAGFLGALGIHEVLSGF